MDFLCPALSLGTCEKTSSVTGSSYRYLIATFVLARLVANFTIPHRPKAACATAGEEARIGKMGESSSYNLIRFIISPCFWFSLLFSEDLS